MAKRCPVCNKRKFKKNLVNNNTECTNCGFVNIHPTEKDEILKGGNNGNKI